MDARRSSLIETNQGKLRILLFFTLLVNVFWLSVSTITLCLASQFYIMRMFNYLEREHLGCMGVRIEEICKDDDVSIYEAKEKK